MIAVCENHTNLLGVRYDPKEGPRDDVRCPLCGVKVRGQRPYEQIGAIVTGRRVKPPAGRDP